MLWFIGAALAAECDDPAAAVTDLERAVLDGRVDEAVALVTAAEASFGCGPIATPQLTARLLLAEAVLAVIQGDNDAADAAFAAAGRISPETWVSDYGVALRSRRDELAATPVPEGTLVLDPWPAGWRAVVDGQDRQAPLRLGEGLHLAQLAPPDHDAMFARVVMVVAGDTTTLETGVPADGALPEPPPGEAPPRAPRKPAPLVIGVSAAALSLGSALGAISQNPAMRNAESLDGLDAAFDRQRGLAWTSYGLLGVSAVSLGLYVAL